MNEPDQRRLERRIELLRAAAADLDDRLARVENSLVFRTLRGAGRIWSDVCDRVEEALFRSPRLRPLHARFFPSPFASYPAWLAAKQVAWNESETASELRISVLLSAVNARPERMRAAIESVLSQRHGAWQLCLAVHAKDTASVSLAEVYAKGDNRVAVAVNGAVPPRTSVQNNAAAAMATGDYVTIVNPNDLLAPGALAWIAAAAAETKAEVVYTDEGCCSATGDPVSPLLKPGWNPELLLSGMYLGRLLSVRRDAGERVGWFRPEFDGAEDYDLALRLDEGGAAFHHVPRIACQRPTGTQYAGAHDAGRRALEASLARRREQVECVEQGPVPNSYGVRRRIPETAGATVIVVSRTAALLERCLQGVATTTAAITRQFIVVQHLSGTAEDAAVARVARSFGVAVIPWPAAFNFSAMNNAAARQAAQHVLMFVNDDVIPLAPGWAEVLLAQASRAEIGVVGAKLLYASGALQHGGLVLGMGSGVGHAGRGQFQFDLWPWMDLPRDVSAVTGACLAIRKSVFAELGGFDASFAVNYNDVDLCLRARKAGYRIVMDPRACLRHDEARTRSARIAFEERERFLDRWGETMSDSFYSSLLDRAHERVQLAPP